MFQAIFGLTWLKCIFNNRTCPKLRGFWLTTFNLSHTPHANLSRCSAQERGSAVRSTRGGTCQILSLRRERGQRQHVEG